VEGIEKIERFERQKNKTIVYVTIGGNSNDIAQRPIIWVSTGGNPKSLPFRFCYHPETASASIREKMDGGNDRRKEFYYPLWFGDEKVPLGAAVTDVFDCRRARVPGRSAARLVQGVGGKGGAFVGRSGEGALTSAAVSAAGVSRTAMVFYHSEATLGTEGFQPQYGRDTRPNAALMGCQFWALWSSEDTLGMERRRPQYGRRRWSNTTLMGYPLWV